MLIVTKKFGYRRNETKDECQENSCQRGDQSKTGGEHGVGMLLLIVGIAEKGSFHSKGQQDQNEDSSRPIGWAYNECRAGRACS